LLVELRKLPWGDELLLPQAPLPAASALTVAIQRLARVTRLEEHEDEGLTLFFALEEGMVMILNLCSLTDPSLRDVLQGSGALLLVNCF
jgi:hypothetical protein